MRATKTTIIIILLLTITLLADDSSRETIFNNKFQVEKSRTENIQIEFNSEIYYLVWSNFKNDVISLEFLREGEELDSYKRMVTIVSHASGTDFTTYLQQYVGAIKSFQIEEPRLYEMKSKKLEKDYIIDVLLLDEKNDKVEHVLSRNYQDKESMVTSIIISSSFSLTKVQKDSSTLKALGKERAGMMESLGNMEIGLF